MLSRLTQKTNDPYVITFSYVTERLFGDQGEDAIVHIINCVRNIRIMVKDIPDPTPNIKNLCGRLEQCRNQENNPDSLGKFCERAN